ncbi:hypothetical protein LINGRAPRIM_LOCUS572 [Linum grandiflorum]
MSSFDSFTAAFINEHVIRTNNIMRSSEHQLAFINSFADRPQLDCIKLDPACLDKYHLNSYGFIGNPRWTDVFNNRETTTFPDAVAQFYCNLQVSGHLMNGLFTTYVDGYLLTITPQLIALVLKLPCSRMSLFSEAEFELHNFDAAAVQKRWIPSKTDDSGFAPASQLPDIHRSLHFLITNIFSPRSDVKFAVTPLDTWIIRCAIANIALNYSSRLQLSHVVSYG